MGEIVCRGERLYGRERLLMCVSEMCVCVCDFVGESIYVCEIVGGIVCVWERLGESVCV